MTRSATRLTAAGFLATAIAFGPARMGFGLFLPDFREDFALGTATAGWIASSGFMAFLVALLASAWLARRAGERLPVTLGALLAASGFAGVATAGTAAELALGIALAGTSAGLCWAPFNDAAERLVTDAERPGALSVISTGTTFGVLAAAGLALGVSAGVVGWRLAWAGFAVAGVVLALAARVALPSGGREGARPARDAVADIMRAVTPARMHPESAPRMRTLGPSLLQRPARPLYATAFCFGMTNAVFLSFAADRVVGQGGLAGIADTAASTVIYLAYGLAGLLGLATGWIEQRIGLAALFVVIFGAGALSLVFMGLWPTRWDAVVAASALHGMGIMMVSAVFSFWSLRLFPGKATDGFTATLISMALGSVLGPALAGTLSEAFGGRAMFLAAALPPLATALWFAAKLPAPRPRLKPIPIRR